MAYEASGIGANGCNEIVPNAMKWLPGSERLSPKTTTLGKSPANADGANEKNSTANRISTGRRSPCDTLLVMFILGLLSWHRRFGRLRSVGIPARRRPSERAGDGRSGLPPGLLSRAASRRGHRDRRDIRSPRHREVLEFCPERLEVTESALGARRRTVCHRCRCRRARATARRTTPTGWWP